MTFVLSLEWWHHIGIRGRSGGKKLGLYTRKVSVSIVYWVKWLHGGDKGKDRAHFTGPCRPHKGLSNVSRYHGSHYMAVGVIWRSLDLSTWCGERSWGEITEVPRPLQRLHCDSQGYKWWLGLGHYSTPVLFHGPCLSSQPSLAKREWEQSDQEISCRQNKYTLAKHVLRAKVVANGVGQWPYSRVGNMPYDSAHLVGLEMLQI